jgi:hypothetical protein
MTGIIPTATLIRAPRKKDREPGRCFEMATVIMISRHEDYRMEAEKSISQINTFIHRDKYGLCTEFRWSRANLEGFVVFRDTLSAQGAHLKSQLSGLRACACGPSWDWSANGCRGESLRPSLFVRSYRLFTIAQVLVSSTVIVMIGFKATRAAMSLGE